MLYNPPYGRYTLVHKVAIQNKEMEACLVGFILAGLIVVLWELGSSIGS